MTLRKGKCGIVAEADYWHGDLQVRLGCVGLHVAVAAYDKNNWFHEQSTIFWTGIRLYAGFGRQFRLRDSIEREQPVEDWMPHMSYEYLMDEVPHMKDYCFTCNNTGSIDCDCGGDICICLESENGLLPCPDCGGGDLIADDYDYDDEPDGDA